VVGRSMLNVIAHARELGYIKCKDELFQPLHHLKQWPEEKVMILTTGSQGEPMAALTRIANGAHRQIKIQAGDTVVFSANPIPGNTLAVVDTIDKLMMQGAKVIYGRHQGIHVSGHGAQEDQKLMLALTRPQFFLPVHGEHRMLVKHAQTAQSMGIPSENMVIIDNGDVVELTQDAIRIGGKVSAGIELVDSSRSGMVERHVLRDRQHLAEDGLVTIAASIDWNGKLMTQPGVHLKGVVNSVEKQRFDQSVQQIIKAVLQEHWPQFSTHTETGEIKVNWNGLEGKLEADLRRFLKREFNRNNPLLVFLLQHPEQQSAEIVDSKYRTPVRAS